MVSLYDLITDSLFTVSARRHLPPEHGPPPPWGNAKDVGGDLLSRRALFCLGLKGKLAPWAGGALSSFPLPVAETAAAVRKGDPSLSPLSLSTMSSTVLGCNLQEGNLELHSAIQGHRQQKCPLMKYLNLLMQQNISRAGGQ